ncbi:MAG: hypothetical protein H0X51_05630 [Parachlamydiaceae bacterium]|nr:hypothetical protein [Parachlamydiaceae bacterium]
MNNDAFYVQKGNIYAVPIVHYNMEMAAQVRLAFQKLKPDCVAVELAETMQSKLLHAASRLPDISVVISYDQAHQPLYYLSEPCDAAFEGLRSALEAQIPAFCIDLDVDYYPDMRDFMPDPYAIQRIGLKQYYESYEMANLPLKNDADLDREMYMARRLKELSLSYDRILFIGGISHIHNVLQQVDRSRFPTLQHAQRETVELCTLNRESCREVLGEFGWISSHYEQLRQSEEEFPPDRQKLIYNLYKAAAEKYKESTELPFPSYNLRNIMKFIRNYALMQQRLMPDLYQILAAARGCVDHNFAYETWALATEYQHLRNVDGLPELDLSTADIWKHTKLFRFHLKQPGRKSSQFHKRRQDKSKFRFLPPGGFSICSYPPEDKVIETFGDFLKKKGTQVLTEEASRSLPFSTSLEEGIDIRETIRHWYDKTLYVKVKGKPPGGVGSVVVIFNEDTPNEDSPYQEKYPWKTTWIGEHQQESDMALYATTLTSNIVGPGISRCEYGGFMMSSPPRRLMDVWSDHDYSECRTKAEVLLMAAIDYSPKPIVVYVGSKPPRTFMKTFAQRYGKKIVYIPIGQLSPTTLNKIRFFHVLDSHDKRSIASDYL